MAAKTSANELEALDRLEQKVRLLVGQMSALRSERDRLVEENRRLGSDLEATRARLVTAEAGASEMEGLRQERDQIRGRVADILEQLEGLDV